MNAPDPQRPLASTAPSHVEKLFPTLTNAQIGENGGAPAQPRGVHLTPGIADLLVRGLS